MKEKNGEFTAGAGGFAFALGMFLYVLITFIGQSILLSVTEAGSFLFYVINSLFSVLALGVTLIALSAYKKVPLIKLCGYKKFNPVYIVISVVIAFGMFAGAGFINGVFAEWLVSLGINAGGADIQMTNVWEYIAFCVTLALLPALVEESFFRGALKSGLSRAGAITAALVTSACFSLYHCSLAQLLYQFIYGVFLFFLAQKSGSAFPAAAAHFLNNFAVLTFGYFGVEVELLNPWLIVSGVIALAASILFLAFYKEKSGKPHKDCAQEEKSLKNDAAAYGGEKDEKTAESRSAAKAFFLPYGLFGVLICLAMLIGGAAA